MNETLELLDKDSAFLSELNLIDYSMLLLKIRKLGPGESDDGNEVQGLEIDENGTFLLKRFTK